MGKESIWKSGNMSARVRSVTINLMSTEVRRGGLMSEPIRSSSADQVEIRCYGGHWDLIPYDVAKKIMNEAHDYKYHSYGPSMREYSFYESDYQPKAYDHGMTHSSGGLLSQLSTKKEENKVEEPKINKTLLLL